jgi:hypothetical protein
MTSIFEGIEQAGRSDPERGIHTLAQWDRFGYRVVKGAKAVDFTLEGEALFNSDQVEPDLPGRYDDLEMYLDYWGDQA